MLQIEQYKHDFLPMAGNSEDNITIKGNKFYNAHKYSVVVEINVVPEHRGTGENLGMGR